MRSIKRMVSRWGMVEWFLASSSVILWTILGTFIFALFFGH